MRLFSVLTEEFTSPLPPAKLLRYVQQCGRHKRDFVGSVADNTFALQRVIKYLFTSDSLLSTLFRKLGVTFAVLKTPFLTLSAEQVQYLTTLTSRGTVTVKAYRRATALLALHHGQSYSAVGRQLGVRYDTVAEWAKQFTARGLAMLQDQPRSGRPLAITGSERAALTALACSPAPDGRSQWSLRLLAGKAVELGHCRQLSASSAHGILKKTSCARTSSGSGVSAS